MLPPPVTRIEQQALAGCRNLHKLTIPAQVVSLGDSLFIDGTTLDTLTLLCTTPPSLNTSVFPEYTAVLIVPCGTAEVYRQHELWGRFTTIIESCTGVEEMEKTKSEIKIHVADGRIVVEGANGETVRIFDSMGREIQAFTHSSNQAFPTGVYMVKVGNHPAKKVMVSGE